uniref:Uncharacterized protein n=1 Tax=Ciona intestinalis TaxID=7719 RepID=H2XM34_CIOIN
MGHQCIGQPISDHWVEAILSCPKTLIMVAATSLKPITWVTGRSGKHFATAPNTPFTHKS